jgi:hypothetical protein
MVRRPRCCRTHGTRGFYSPAAQVAGTQGAHTERRGLRSVSAKATRRCLGVERAVTCSVRAPTRYPQARRLCRYCAAALPITLVRSAAFDVCVAATRSTPLLSRSGAMIVAAGGPPSSPHPSSTTHRTHLAHIFIARRSTARPVPPRDAATRVTLAARRRSRGTPAPAAVRTWATTAPRTSGRLSRGRCGPPAGSGSGGTGCRGTGGRRACGSPRSIASRRRARPPGAQQRAGATSCDERKRRRGGTSSAIA